jgi:hypothetical protein
MQDIACTRESDARLMPKATAPYKGNIINELTKIQRMDSRP